MKPFDFDTAPLRRRPSSVVDCPVVLIFTLQLFLLKLHSVIEVRLVVLPPDIHSLTDVSHASELLECLVAKEDLRPSGLLLLDALLREERHDRWQLRQSSLGLHIFKDLFHQE